MASNLFTPEEAATLASLGYTLAAESNTNQMLTVRAALHHVASRLSIYSLQLDEVRSRLMAADPSPERDAEINSITEQLAQHDQLQHQWRSARNTMIQSMNATAHVSEADLRQDLEKAQKYYAAMSSIEAAIAPV
jgi:DNA repair ATPase RecN